MRDFIRDSQLSREGQSMSGSHVAGKLIVAERRPTEVVDIRTRAHDRMAWPAAALLILLMAAGLWWGLIAALRYVLA